MNVIDEMDVMERSAHVAMRVMLGEALTARQIADEYGISRQQAHVTLSRLARVLPLISQSGLWRVSDLCQVE